MMHTDEERQEKPDPGSNRRLWQRCRSADAPDDEAAHFLVLAAFADGFLVEEEQDRVAALLDLDPDAAADVGVARALRGSDPGPGGLERVIARACQIRLDGPGPRDRVVALATRPSRRLVHYFAQWGSLAAALLLAGWLGFALGTDASLALSEPRQPNEVSFLPEFFEPATGLFRDLGEGPQT